MAETADPSTPAQSPVPNASVTPPQPVAPAEAAPPPPGAAPAGEPTPPLSVRTLLEAGAHFGHQTRRWNPKMRPYIYGERNGIHIIDLDQTYERFRAALDFIRETTASGGKVLLVGTKRQARAPVQFEAQRCGQFYVNNRWLGGMLTNFKTVKKSIERFKEHLALVADEEQRAELTKKELSRINRSIERYRKSLDGIKQLERLPSAVFVVDVNCDEIAVAEAKRLRIPIVAVVDTNCDPEGIDFVVPANDDATRALQLYCSHVADACLEGDALFDERVQAQVADEQAARARAPQREAAPATGRVVVEIHQPPRRGRGAAGRREPREEREPEEAAPAAAEASEPPADPAPDGSDAGAQGDGSS